jgi:hypothetical protein
MAETPVFLRERFCCHYYREGPLLREQSTGHLSAPIVFVEAAMVHELFSALVTVRASTSKKSRGDCASPTDFP